jgi:ankyrin repeat protein
MVSLLTQGGANIDLRNAQWWTALHFAASSKWASTALVDVLLKNGVSVAGVDKQGLTAWEVAQKCGNHLTAEKIEAFVNQGISQPLVINEINTER